MKTIDALRAFAKNTIGRDLNGMSLSVVLPSDVDEDGYNAWNFFGRVLTRVAEEYGVIVSPTFDPSADGIAILGKGDRWHIPRDKDIMRVTYKSGDVLRPPFISAALNIMSWKGLPKDGPWCISGYDKVLVDILRGFGGSRIDNTCNYGLAVRPGMAPDYYIPTYPNDKTCDVAAIIAMLNFYDLMMW